MKARAIIFAIGIAMCTILPFTASANEPYVVKEEINPAVITHEDYDAWLQSSSEFAEAENALTDAYHKTLEAVGPGGDGWLRMNQVDWVKERQAATYKNFGPKGSPQYFEALNREADKRRAWLDNLAKKGNTVYINSYLYTKPGFNGLLTIYYRKDAMLELDLHTQNTKTKAVCVAQGISKTSNAKASYSVSGGTIELEILELGKGIRLSSNSESSICQDSRFSGDYELTK